MVLFFFVVAMLGIRTYIATCLLFVLSAVASPTRLGFQARKVSLAAQGLFFSAKNQSIKSIMDVIFASALSSLAANV